MFMKDILFDKSIYEINLLESRSSFKTYSSEEDYINKNINEIIINDKWKGIYLNTLPEDLNDFLSNIDEKDLVDIEVPLSLELQGYGQVQYVNTQYEFDGYNTSKIGDIPNVNIPCFIYQRNLAISNEDKDKKIIINFKGFESGLFLYVNNSFVGYSENLYLDSEFDISKHLNVGDNKINVVVSKYSSSSWLLNQDFFRFMGLFRDVSIKKLNPMHIFDIHVKTQNNGITNVMLTGEIGGLTKEIEIISPLNKIIYKSKTSSNSFDFKIEHPMLWSAETPNLYKLIIKTFFQDNLIEIVEENYGYKEVKIENATLYFNDKRLKIFGINRHEWNHLRGRNVTFDDMLFDVEFLKKHNVNAIRTSHYPNHPSFYELTDKYGIYVMDEACLETHSSLTTYNTIGYETQIPGDDPSWNHICINKVRRMYLRDKNHPSIFMYSLGNESGYGQILNNMYNELKKLDSNILVHYEWACRVAGKDVCTDVFSQMYTPAKGIDKLLTNYKEKPYLICEYAHAMGNSLGAIDKYIALLEKHQNYHGGFIWDYIDQGIYTIDNLGRNVLNYGSDFLEKPSDYDFCCNGVIFADRTFANEAPKAIEMKYQYQQIDFKLNGKILKIKNNYLFTNLNKYKFIFKVFNDDKEVKTFEEVFDILPDNELDFMLDFENLLFGETILQINVYDNDCQIAYKHYVLSNNEKEKKVEKQKLNVIDGRYNIGVKVGNLNLLFAKSSISYHLGGLISLKIMDEEYLVDEILPSIFRPTTNNDYANYFMYDNSILLSYSKYMRLDYKSTKYEYDEEKFVIKYKYLLDHRNETGIWIKYQVNNLAEIIIDVEYEKLNDISEIGMLGLRFNLLKNKQRIKYCGLSGETYQDRKAGGIYGVYDLDVADGYTNYMTPQECGNHEDTRWLIINGEKTNLRFEYVKDLFKFKFMEYSDFAIECATHFEELTKTRKNYLTLMGYTRGIGGDNTWGAKVHDEFCIKNENLAFSIKLFEFKKGDK